MAENVFREYWAIISFSAQEPDRLSSKANLVLAIPGASFKRLKKWIGKDFLKIR